MRKDGFPSTQKHAGVMLREQGRIVLVPISSDKPPIDASVLGKWQKLADLAAQVMNVPAGLIMQLHKDKIDVLISSSTGGNPYHPGDSEKLGMGLYCETVIGSGKKLHVNNSLYDITWSENPDVKLGMISYLGYPLAWPDGEIFGTICVLDNKTNPFPDQQTAFMKHLKDTVELDLKTLLEKEELRKKNVHNNLLIREIHHRIKNNFNHVINYLNMKEIDPGDDSPDVILNHLKSRIKTISLIHEKIYNSANAEDLSLPEYLKELAIVVAGYFDRPDMQIIVKGECVNLSMNSTVTIGTIVNEIITNAIKYAFGSTPQPEINITLARDGKILVMSCGHNGEPIPLNLDLENTESLGIDLIMNLPRYLNGTCTLAADRRTYNFTFSV